MKKFILTILTVLIVFTPAFADEAPQKTVNSALADAIVSVSQKTGEVFDFTVAGVSRAIDMVEKEAPKVVEEFLTWRFIQALVPFWGWFDFLHHPTRYNVSTLSFL